MPADYLLAVSAAPWPLEILAYCYDTVAKDADVREAGRQWNERNGKLLANIEARAKAAALADDVRRKADEASLAAIRDTVDGQGDKAAYCRTIARVVDSGAYDIDQRADLKDALRRIFGEE